MMVYVAPIEGRARLGAEDTVLVSLGDRIVARMKTLRSLLQIERANVARQQPVDGLAEVGDRNRVRKRECSHLAQRMHAGIGATRPGDVYGRAFNSFQNSLEGALNRGQAGLDLPAVKIGPVVAQSDADTPHDTGRD